MSNPHDFFLTTHAIQRLHERCSEFAKEANLIKDQFLRKKTTYDFLYGATEDKRFLNNSIFMTMLGEKYGFENRYTMFIRDDNIFVGITNKRGSFIVTVMKKSEHYISHVRVKVQKYRRK